MKYKIWDKKEKINGIEASYFINKFNIKKDDEVIQILDKLGNTDKIVFKNNAIVSYDLDINLTTEQVAQKYLEIKQQEEQSSKEEIENKLIQQEEIERLKQENASINYILMKNDLL